MIITRELISPGSEHDKQWEQLKGRLKEILCNNRGQLHVAQAGETELASEIGNSRQLSRAILETSVGLLFIEF